MTSQLVAKCSPQSQVFWGLYVFCVTTVVISHCSKGVAPALSTTSRQTSNVQQQMTGVRILFRLLLEERFTSCKLFLAFYTKRLVVQTMQSRCKSDWVWGWVCVGMGRIVRYHFVVTY